MYYYVENSARSGRIICEVVSQFLRGRVADISRQGRKFFGGRHAVSHFFGALFPGASRTPPTNAGGGARLLSVIYYQISSTMT